MSKQRLFTTLKLGLLTLVASFSIFFVFAPSAYAADPCAPGQRTATFKNCVMDKYVNPAIRLLAILTGIAVVGGIIWGGIQYSMSAGDAQKVAKGKSTIMKALTGLVAFLLLGTFLQFVTPGGLVSQSGGCQRSFLGLKAWYAYIPGIDAKTCKVPDNLQLLPNGDNIGIVAPITLAIVDDLMRIAAMVAVVFVIVGGVQYMTSQGDVSRTKQALSTIINALIGLAIALVAAAVVSYLGGALIK